MKKLAYLSALAVALPLVASPAAAKDLERDKFETRAERQFEKMDLNSDGMVAGEEIIAWVTEKQEKRAERRGTEMRDINDRRVDKMVDPLDSDGDGAISKEEYVISRLAWFDSKDADSNGVLENSERGEGAGSDGMMEDSEVGES